MLLARGLWLELKLCPRQLRAGYPPPRPSVLRARPFLQDLGVRPEHCRLHCHAGWERRCFIRCTGRQGDPALLCLAERPDAPQNTLAGTTVLLPGVAGRSLGCRRFGNGADILVGGQSSLSLWTLAEDSRSPRASCTPRFQRTIEASPPSPSRLILGCFSPRRSMPLFTSSSSAGWLVYRRMCTQSPNLMAPSTTTRSRFEL